MGWPFRFEPCPDEVGQAFVTWQWPAIECGLRLPPWVDSLTLGGQLSSAEGKFWRGLTAGIAELLEAGAIGISPGSLKEHLTGAALCSLQTLWSVNRRKQN